MVVLNLHNPVLMLLGLILVSQLLCIFAQQQPESIPLKVINHAGEPIELFWLDEVSSDTDELVNQLTKPLRNGSETAINSFEGHSFIARYFKHRDDVEVKFTKGPKEETFVISFDEDENNLVAKPASTYDEIRSVIADATEKCFGLAGDDFSSCIADGVIEDFATIAEARVQLRKQRDAISFKLRNYTCADPNMQTTEPISSYPFEHNDQLFDVKVLLNLTHAKIWMVEDFISDEECNILVEHGRPKLHRATVAAEDGTSIVSEHRKANQASYNSHYRNGEDPLWPLQQRILAVTNHHANMSLKIEGQEGFTIIQYNMDDQYTPHCDGACDNMPHVPTGRVATAVLYCIAPEEGGATTFTKADVYVRPKRNAATFFSYKGSDGRMDEGYTEHSGCPVTKGEKWITTFWMREGVDEEHNWTMYDPSGLRILESE